MADAKLASGDESPPSILASTASASSVVGTATAVTAPSSDNPRVSIEESEETPVTRALAQGVYSPPLFFFHYHLSPSR